MPRVRRRAKLRAGYTAEHLDQLREGPFYCLSATLTRQGWPDARHMQRAELVPLFTEMREAWQVLRDQVLPAFIAGHSGCRPWAWWMFDATEPRQLLDGPGSHYWLMLGHADRWRETFGAPTCLSGYDFTDPSTYETEFEYLDRLGLLGDDERSAHAVFSIDGTLNRTTQG